MSRSYRKNYKSPVCGTGRNGIRKWKHDTKQQRRAREHAQLFKIYEDDEGFDEESCTPIKYQKQKDMTDWSGPHDGWNRMSVRAAEEMWDEIDGKSYKGHRK